MKILAVAVALIALTGCADSVSHANAASMDPVGFWHGLWHGSIIMFSWVISLFSDSTAIYATYNNGGWYDFGFMLGLGSAFSSSVTYTKKRP
jgi:hypothetical protein